MDDEIFLSYSSQDRAAAKRLAEALEGRGFGVWWDKEIPPGKTFDQVIEERLDAAQAVVVLWSARSAGSPWVRTEAGEVVMDDLGFSQPNPGFLAARVSGAPVSGQGGGRD